MSVFSNWQVYLYTSKSDHTLASLHVSLYYYLRAVCHETKQSTSKGPRHFASFLTAMTYLPHLPHIFLLFLWLLFWVLSKGEINWAGLHPTRRNSVWKKKPDLMQYPGQRIPSSNLLLLHYYPASLKIYTLCLGSAFLMLHPLPKMNCRPKYSWMKRMEVLVKVGCRDGLICLNRTLHHWERIGVS